MKTFHQWNIGNQTGCVGRRGDVPRHTRLSLPAFSSHILPSFPKPLSLPILPSNNNKAPSKHPPPPQNPPNKRAHAFNDHKLYPPPLSHALSLFLQLKTHTMCRSHSDTAFPLSVPPLSGGALVVAVAGNRGGRPPLHVLPFSSPPELLSSPFPTTPHPPHPPPLLHIRNATQRPSPFPTSLTHSLTHPLPLFAFFLLHFLLDIPQGTFYCIATCGNVFSLFLSLCPPFFPFPFFFFVCVLYCSDPLPHPSPSPRDVRTCG